jgi:DtxR family transcriptional regulator, Mn-dependent transcriptional regulator
VGLTRRAAPVIRPVSGTPSVNRPDDVVDGPYAWRVTDLIDTTEMYLRTIFELEEEGIVPLRARIAERLGHSGPTVSQTVARMERDGLVKVAGDRHLELSDEGRLRATRVMRKHRIAERLLVDVIRLEWEYVHEEACRWEHVMSERVERKILAILPDHLESPYGNPIPGLAELGEIGKSIDFRLGLSTLDEIASDGPATVVVRRIGEPVQVDSEALALLTEAGLLPGRSVRVHREGARVVAVGAEVDAGGAVSLPRDISSHVFVAPA